MGKLGPKIVKNEIAGLRHFLPRRHFLRFFFVYKGLNKLSFFALFFLEVFLGGLWTQKRVKIDVFLRLLKRLFEAPDGPLGLILAHSG